MCNVILDLESEKEIKNYTYISKIIKYPILTVYIIYIYICLKIQNSNVDIPILTNDDIRYKILNFLIIQLNAIFKYKLFYYRYDLTMNIYILDIE